MSQGRRKSAPKTEEVYSQYIRISSEQRTPTAKQERLTREKSWNMGYEPAAPMPEYTALEDAYCPFTHSQIFYQEQRKAGRRALGKKRRKKRRQKGASTEDESFTLPSAKGVVSPTASVTSTSSSLPPPVSGSPYFFESSVSDVDVMYRGTISREVKVCVQEGSGKVVIGRVPLYSGDTFVHLRKRIARELGIIDFQFVSLDQLSNTSPNAKSHAKVQAQALVDTKLSEVFIDPRTPAQPFPVSSAGVTAEPVSIAALENEVHRIQTAVAAGDFSSAPYLRDLQQQLEAARNERADAIGGSNSAFSSAAPPLVQRPPPAMPQQLDPLSVSASPRAAAQTSDTADDDLKQKQLKFIEFSAAMDESGGGDSSSYPSALRKHVRELSEKYHQLYETEVQQFADALKMKLREQYERQILDLQADREPADAPEEDEAETAKQESEVEEEEPAMPEVDVDDGQGEKRRSRRISLQMQRSLARAEARDKKLSQASLTSLAEMEREEDGGREEEQQPPPPVVEQQTTRGTSGKSFARQKALGRKPSRELAARLDASGARQDLRALHSKTAAKGREDNDPLPTTFTLGQVLQSTVVMVNGDLMMVSFHESSAKVEEEEEEGGQQSGQDPAPTHLSLRGVSTSSEGIFAGTLSAAEWAGTSFGTLSDLVPKDKQALCDAIAKKLVLDDGVLKLGGGASAPALSAITESPDQPPVFKVIEDTAPLSSRSAGVKRSRSIRRPKSKAAAQQQQQQQQQ